jgi:hypothetical protein
MIDLIHHNQAKRRSGKIKSTLRPGNTAQVVDMRALADEAEHIPDKSPRHREKGRVE